MANDDTNWIYTTTASNTIGYVNPMGGAWHGDPYRYVQPDWSKLVQQYAYPQPHIDIVESENKKEEPMRGLYHVYVVDPESAEIVQDFVTVAKDADAARLKAAKKLPDDVDLDDYDLIVDHVGAVRAKRQVQEVKIAK